MTGTPHQSHRADPSHSAQRTDRLLPVVRARSWSDHLSRLGPTQIRPAVELSRALEAASLLGRGGAGFPTGRKLHSVIAAVRKTRMPAVVVANCCEGDPTSLKDRVLIDHSPHLVIDGALAAAAAVGADRVILAVHERSAAQRTLLAGVGERRDAGNCQIDVIGLPARYIASEATSLVRFLNTGDARPGGKLNPVWESGVGGRPTLIDNAETLAHLALLARFGSAWFAGVGAPDEPGTTLVTIGGAVRTRGVVEVPNGATLRQVLACSGAKATGWALIGGVAGHWISLDLCGDSHYSTAGLARIGATRGVGSIVVLPPGGCPLVETARILDFQAHAGARQCGPCMFGLPAIAADMNALTGGGARSGAVGGGRGALARLRTRLPVINGRGGCGHPDGAVSIAASALEALTSQPGHLAQHLKTGGCQAPSPVVPLGHQPGRVRAATRRAS